MMIGLLRVLEIIRVVIGSTFLGIDNWVEKLLVGTAAIAIAILAVVIAWGLIDGRYSIVMPF